MPQRKNKRLVSSLSFLALFVAMIDLMTNAAATGLLTAAISVPHINPPPKNVAEKKVSIAPMALFMQLRWVTNAPHDVDTHVRCWQESSGEVRNVVEVNYMQRLHRWLGLDRDDLGRPSVINIEVVKSNSEVSVVPPNARCRVNAHLYHSHGGEMPVAGDLVVIEQKDGDNEKALAVVEFMLKTPGEELTLFYAEWDARGQIISGSVKVYPDVEFTANATEGSE